eukprot:scaffold3588_cov92-Cylindrotheca_fusiformis.AAC.1
MAESAGLRRGGRRGAGGFGFRFGARDEPEEEEARIPRAEEAEEVEVEDQPPEVAEGNPEAGQEE